MNTLGKVLFEWLVLRLLWGPWSLLLGIIWTITDDVAEDVVLARALFGMFGTTVLASGIAGFFLVEAPHFAWLVPVGCLAAYILGAALLKAILSGRDEHLFSLPR